MSTDMSAPRTGRAGGVRYSDEIGVGAGWGGLDEVGAQGVLSLALQESLGGTHPGAVGGPLPGLVRTVPYKLPVARRPYRLLGILETTRAGTPGIALSPGRIAWVRD